MRLSVVVVNWNSREDLAACLESLQAQTHDDLETIVVDNGSTDGSAQMVRDRFPRCKLLAETENLGFAEACNRGIVASTGPWVAMLNNDAVAEPDWAEALMKAAAEAPDNCGMLQSLMLFMQRRDTINSIGIDLLRTGRGHDRYEGLRREAARKAEEIFCPTAGAAAYRRAMLDSIKLQTGWFDRTHFMYYEDLDLGWRARLNGWTAKFVPESVVFHRYHGSSDRHGRPWMLVISRTNRLRTMVKNASLRMLARSAHHSLYDVAVVLWNGGLKSGVKLAEALQVSVRERREVNAMVKERRRGVERRWVKRKRV
ncbi:MAG: glycosyltransferase family 2 protein [Deltaproteobacteria bacterium]|nr:glycosyltransferase family 2 protein [Deltaproteobacteria bacterium]